MTEDYTALDRFSVTRNENGLGFSNGIVLDDKGRFVRYSDHVDAIASLERQLAELPSQALWDESRKALASMRNENGELSHRATTAEAERDRLAARCGELERALRRAQTILTHMAAMEPVANYLQPILGPERWSIAAEPLRHDARNLLPLVDAALQEPQT